MRRRFDLDQLRITRGALTIAGIEIGLSLVWLMLAPEQKAHLVGWVAAAPTTVFREGHVWTLATSVFIEPDFLSLLLGVIVLWGLIPTLERFWGIKRFYRFFAITSLTGTIAGTLFGLAIGRDEAIFGLSPFIYASIVAFGIVYAKAPVQFFGVLPLTGRQLMYGFIGFLALYIGLQGEWVKGVAFAAAMLAAAILVSKSANPRVLWKRWQLARARAKLAVLDGGRAKPKRDGYLN